MLFRKSHQQQNDIDSDEKLRRLNEKFERKRNLTGFWAKIFSVLAISMSLYHIYTSGIYMPPQFQHRVIHLAFALALTFLLFPASSSQKDRLPWYDIVAVLISFGTAIYLCINYLPIVFRMGSPVELDILLGAVTILLVFEATRRTMGWPMVIVSSLFLAYSLYGHLIPGILGHRYYSFSRVVEHMFLTSEGIYGVAIYVTATFVFVFILLGAFLTETGGAQAFIDLSFSITGRYRGGPAKAAVVASGLMGTISGSSFANVAGTGTFTIPLMKSVGYKPEFAGGVEAAASTGGQIMPPIMGAAAFIMAEMTGIPYGKIIVHAAVPAILYYIAVFIMVDMEAAKMGLFGLQKEQLPSFRAVFKSGGFLLLSPLSIVYMLLIGYSPIKASITAVLILFIISFFKQETRLTPKKILHALEEGAKGALSVIAACAVAGLIVGTVTLTGLGLKFADLIVALSMGSIYPALVMTMLASILMGMGMPTTALYIILGAMVAPALVKLNVPVIAAHLFIFYFGCMASVTPPVALSSYLAAAIARADSVKTAMQGLKLASSAFIFPFIFAISPALILFETSFFPALVAFITALLGVTALSGCLENYLWGRLGPIKRIFLGAAALCLMIPEWHTDTAGFLVLLAVVLSNISIRRKEMRSKKM